MDFIKNIRKAVVKFCPLLVFVFFAIILLAFTNFYVDSTNSASRFSTMESLVENKSFTINEKHIYTDDKMMRDGNYYSSKPPMLSVMGGGIYYILYNYFNLDLPDKYYLINEPSAIVPNTSIYIINLILIGGTFLLLLFFFYKTLNLLNIEKKYQILLLMGIGLGTLYFTYSITLNNHTVAGSFLFVGFYYLLKTKIEKINFKKSLLLAGVFTSLAATIDLPTGLVFIFLFGVYILLIHPKKYILYFILSMIPILTAHLFFNYQITGDFLPVQLHPEFGYGENLSIGHAKVWASISGDGAVMDRSKISYVFNILFGTHGLFLYSPILLFAIYSMYKIIKDKKHQFRPEAILIFIGFILIILFYAIRVRVYTGAAFGFRWLIAVTPLIYFFNIFLFTKKPSYKFFNFFIIIFIISASISLVGFTRPWPSKYIIIEAQNIQYRIQFPLLVNLKMLFY